MAEEKENWFHTLTDPFAPYHAIVRDTVPFPVRDYYDQAIANQTTQEKPVTDNKDNIKHPSHYTQGSIETIDYIKDTLTSEEFTGHCIGSSLKYLSRWRHKGGIEDLEKASVYLGWAIDNELGTVK